MFLIHGTLLVQFSRDLSTTFLFSSCCCCVTFLRPPSPRRINHSRARRRGRRWPTRKSLERMNLLYLLLCYAIIKTEDGAGQKEIMVFTQHTESERLYRDAVRGENNILLQTASHLHVQSYCPSSAEETVWFHVHWSCCSSSSPRLRPPAPDPHTDGRATS